MTAACPWHSLKKFESKTTIDRISPGELPNRHQTMTEILIDGLVEQRHVLTPQCATPIFVRTRAREADGVCDVNTAPSVITPVCGQRVAREPEQVWPQSGRAQRHWHRALAEAPPDTQSASTSARQMTICHTP